MSLFSNNARIGASAAGDYEIERSLRFNPEDSTYLSRTPSSSTYKKGTYSFWFKRCKEGAINSIIQSGRDGGGNDQAQIAVWSDDQIQVMSYSSSAYQLELKTTPKYRDPASWYHLLFAWDTTQGVAANRAKLYINGEQVTAFATSTYPAADDLMMFDNPNASASGVNRIGAYWGSSYNSDHSFSGYITELHYVDGTALDPTSFGKTNADTGQWIPKKYGGAHGTNGYYLKFDDNSGTTSTTLGKDSAGSNDWTPNNFSVAAGAGNDSMLDTPTTNYPTLNSLHWCSLLGGGGTSLGPDYTQGNLRFVSPSSAVSPYHRTTGGTITVSSGAWYFEVTIENFTNGNGIGVAEANNLDSNGGWEGAGRWTWNCFDEQKTIAGTSTSYGTKPSNGDIVGCAVDIDNNTIEWFVNNSSQGKVTSIGISGKFVTVGALVVTFANERYTINFGQQGFAYTPPTGFEALNTANLPEPTIVEGEDHFNAVTYTGTGSDLAVTGVGFQSDLVWIKNRSNGGNWHDVYDSTRGVTKRIFPNEPDAEQTQSEGLKAFSSDGWTVGNNSDVGSSGNTYVGWNWKESATAGFDIVTYTGNATVGGGGPNNQTISHNLGVVPQFFMVKALTAPYSGGGHWSVYHKDLSNPTDYFLNLNKNVPEVTSSTSMWNQTAPTSSVFSVGLEYDSNHNGTTYMGYIFAGVEGYSKFGKYLGNGGTFGTFVHTGFKPAALIVKCINSTEDWQIWDNTRDTTNLMFHRLFPSNADAETDTINSASSQLDFYSNGFKWRGQSDDTNGSGDTYVYAAFAEGPFKYANAR